MTTITSNEQITKEQLRTLRGKNISSLGVKFVKKESFLLAYDKTGKETEVHEIRIRSYVYGDPKRTYPNANQDHLPEMEGFYSNVGATDVIDTVIDLLKEGDEITAEWYEGNNNGYLEDTTYSSPKFRPYDKLYRDDLYLRVKRTVRGKDKIYNFLITSSVAADSSTSPSNSARLCRRVW